MTTTKNGSIRAPTELDLDSLLRSHGGDLSSSDDGDSAVLCHRTVDEILNDPDSSDDSSDSSSSLPIQQNPKPQQLEESNESTSHALEKEVEEEQSSLTWRRSGSRELLSWSSSSANSLSSLGFRAAAASPSAVRPLPPLFGGVSLNTKPGAALAAAAAASRSIPTPHAMAIKNRRGSRVQKVESGGDLQEIGDLSDVVATTPVNDDDGEKEICVTISQSSSSASVEAESAAVSEEVAEKEVSENAEGPPSVEEIDVSHSAEAKENSLEDILVEASSLAATSAVTDEHAQQADDEMPLQEEEVSQIARQAYDTVPSQEEEVSVVDNVDEISVQEVVREVPDAEKGYDSDKEASDDEKLRGNIGAEGDMGDEIDKLVEERLEQLESSKKAEKKLRSSMKPLEWAEELEKKHASYGQHWEEGAAAQPMRLEGIRRGPPAVGYLQIDLDNAVTRTISSQAFKRDCGTPQVVAVHMNFIAMGMSKGVVFVFPSKYSAHSVDHMDSKVRSPHPQPPEIYQLLAVLMQAYIPTFNNISCNIVCPL